ncbi:hypothetical protein DM02DRAFT_149872 [Periconia macrospinosa]|uniref:Uncharacterized protein n=1 Tax=Periconia macrospinosa TaxID=97972 RepID=A0A2V1DE39_9PLEO|nr:hypothetical protein DM02DRAFT_149872 [Periconia macrospinosa]
MFCQTDISIRERNRMTIAITIIHISMYKSCVNWLCVHFYIQLSLAHVVFFTSRQSPECLSERMPSRPSSCSRIYAK